MAEFVAQIKDALSRNDAATIDRLRKAGLHQLTKSPGSLPNQALDFLARACAYGGDEQGLAMIGERLPKETTPGYANLSLREMAHLQMARGYVYCGRKDAERARHCFQSVRELAGYFGDSGMQALAQSLMQETPS